jgi:hypothetical protein
MCLRIQETENSIAQTRFFFCRAAGWFLGYSDVSRILQSSNGMHDTFDMQTVGDVNDESGDGKKKRFFSAGGAEKKFFLVQKRWKKKGALVQEKWKKGVLVQIVCVCGCVAQGPKRAYTLGARSYLGRCGRFFFFFLSGGVGRGSSEGHGATRGGGGGEAHPRGASVFFFFRASFPGIRTPPAFRHDVVPLPWRCVFLPPFLFRGVRAVWSTPSGVSPSVALWLFFFPLFFFFFFVSARACACE